MHRHRTAKTRSFPKMRKKNFIYRHCYPSSFMKSGGDCMRSANKSPKIPLSAMLREEVK